MIRKAQKDIRITIKNAVTKVNRWFQNNSLTFNLNKTNLIHFATKTTVNIPACIELGQNRSTNSQTINILCLTLDYTFSLSSHIARICNKLRSACYILKILKPNLTTQNLKAIYFAYFHSIMSYGIIFWGTLLIMMKYLNCKIGLSVLWPIPATGHPLVGYSRSCLFCHFVPNTY